MKSTAEFASAFQRARDLQRQGRLAEAERAYVELANPGPHREAVLRALVELYWQARRPDEVIATLTTLANEVPDSLNYCARLAGLLDGLGRIPEAIDRYRRFLQRQPRSAAAHFNLALLHKKEKHYPEALACYLEAIRLRIDRVQEVYSNMGVLYSEMRDASQARRMYERALAIDPHYVPALFNLAGLCEELGDRPQAIDLYRRILALDAQHWEALARITHAQKVTQQDDRIVSSLRTALADPRNDRWAREALYFALGKALDDLGRYPEAFAAYAAGNELGKLRNPPYDAMAVQRMCDRLIKVFDPAWMQAVGSPSPDEPVFICGMFRSGSTLVEQILAAHPAITAGGELDQLPWLIARRLAPYPERVRSLSRHELQQLGEEYTRSVRALLPTATVVTDKRPDNFLHLGLIKLLFPAARIIYTKRQPLDNFLSIYFQQLGGNLNYATDLQNTAHYHGQQERLMDHWRASFGENIFTVDYDELVRSPEPVLRRLLDFLHLPWDARCLEFQSARSQVKTASVWQVREELHTRSSGRWRNYEPFIGRLQESLAARTSSDSPPPNGPARS